MDYLFFILLVSSLTGFVAGFLGSVVHQQKQRIADKKRWELLKTTQGTSVDDLGAENLNTDKTD